MLNNTVDAGLTEDWFFPIEGLDPRHGCPGRHLPQGGVADVDETSVPQVDNIPFHLGRDPRGVGRYSVEVVQSFPRTTGSDHGPFGVPDVG